MSLGSSPDRLRERRTEDYAYILDTFDAESSLAHRRYRGQVAQLMGEKYFIMLEGLARQSAELDTSDRVYVGPGSRGKIAVVLRRIAMDDLTAFAKGEIGRTVEKSISLNESRWTDVLNTMGSLTPRLHSLQLLPGIGRKMVWAVITEREKRPFRGFTDFQMRTRIDPLKTLAKRVRDELAGSQKYYLFVDFYGRKS
ncbi:MAG: DUF655 domain-containing protein [Candidatus Geothermarchaeales archaeon]